MKKRIFIISAILVIGLLSYFFSEKVSTEEVVKTNKQEIVADDVVTKIPEEMSSVRMGLLNSRCKPDNLPYLVAMENGYFSAEGVEIKVSEGQGGNESWGDSAEILKNFDLIVAGRARIYYFEATNPNSWKSFIGNINTLEKNDYAILVKNTSKVTDLASLSGSTIGVEKGSGHARFVLMKMVLEKLNLNFLNYKIVDATTADLSENNVSALYLREPQLSLAMSQGLYRIIVDAPIVNYIQNPWPQGYYALSSEFIENNSVVSQKVVTALTKAVEFIKANREASDTILSQCAQTSYAIDKVKFREFEYWTIDQFDKDAIQKQINLYHEKNLIPKNFDVSDFVLKN